MRFICSDWSLHVHSPQYQRPFTVTLPSPQKRMQMIAELRNAAQFKHTPSLLQINDVAMAHVLLGDVEWLSAASPCLHARLTNQEANLLSELSSKYETKLACNNLIFDFSDFFCRFWFALFPICLLFWCVLIFAGFSWIFLRFSVLCWFCFLMLSAFLYFLEVFLSFLFYDFCVCLIHFLSFSFHCLMFSAVFLMVVVVFLWFS